MVIFSSFTYKETGLRESRQSTKDYTDTSVLPMSLTTLDQRSFLTKMPDWLLQEMEVHFLALRGSEWIHWKLPVSVSLVILKSPLFSSIGQCHVQHLVTLLIKWTCLDSLCEWVMHVCICVIALFNWLCGCLGKERMPDNIAASIPHKSQVTGQRGAF